VVLCRQQEDAMMTPHPEPDDVLTAMEHAATLRRLLVVAVTTAIVETVERYTGAHPGQPWAFDPRPGATGLRGSVDLLLDDLVEAAALGRPVDGVMMAFPSRLVLGASADADEGG
jgi:hypothetical protein